MKQFFLSAILFSIGTTPLYAATMMEATTKDNHLSRVWINDSYARMAILKQQHGQDNATKEMIIDLKANKMYGVVPTSKILVDISRSSLPGLPLPQTPHAKISIDSQGRGPAIAGFSTHKYLVSANGKKCYTMFFSKDVLKYRQLGKFYDVMSRISQVGSHEATTCGAADEQIAKLPKEKYGVILKSIDQSGKTMMEVKQIKEGVTPPAHYLQLPAGYRTMSMAAIMKQMQNQMRTQSK